ncbi:hypothetical protein FKP32DRAFT_1055673 [Trametes sanguinea]|nr:hypothetical protein FKP32DRAFT_1055673 [Trametes sanguinea]
MADGRGRAFGRGESCTPVIPVSHPTLDAGSVLADHLSSNIVMLPFLYPQFLAATTGKKLKNDINDASGNRNPPRIKTHGHTRRRRGWRRIWITPGCQPPRQCQVQYPLSLSCSSPGIHRAASSDSHSSTSTRHQQTSEPSRCFHSTLSDMEIEG